MATTAASLETGFQLHQAGKLREAEAIYRQVLAVDPQQFDALHLLGVLAHQTGQHQAALACISRAVMLKGDQPAFHHNLGEVYRTLGQLREACQCYFQALKLNPLLPKTHHSLGIILKHQGDVAGAISHFRQTAQLDPRFAGIHGDLGTVLIADGKLSDAAESFLRAIEFEPAESDHYVNLGAVYQRQGKLDDATALYRQAIQINPQSGHAFNNLGAVLKQQEQLDDAAEAFRSALARSPDLVEARYSLAVIQHQQGQMATAAKNYRGVLKLNPDHVEALCNYGNLIQSESKLDQALECYRRAIALQPDFAPAYFGRGNALDAKKLPREAVAAYREAVRLDAGYFEAYNNLALALNALVQPDEALEACQKGLALQPNSGELYANLAIALQMQGCGADSVAAHRKAVELRPQDASEFSNLLFCLNFRPDYDPQTLYAEHLEWARRHAEPLTAQSAPHANDRSPERRLRIGYLSPFFRQHAVNYFSEPMIAAHDHQHFEIYCYSDVPKPDAVTSRIKAAADCWRDVFGKSDEEVATRVRDDQIDILVDLTGHIGDNRLPIFARKPAPIQVTYLGYQNTTGMSAMDYRLTDAFADPSGLCDAYYTEQLIRLPRSFFCFQPSDDSPEITSLPAIKNQYITFGSFNNVAKVSDRALDAWFELLARVPGSRLLMLGYRGGTLERNLHRRAAQSGIAPERVELCDRQPHREFLELIARADIALDPFPFNGHTTTCDLIWMGVPVVMLLGQTYASRFGGSVLTNVGLESWMSLSVDEYIDTAVRWAEDLDALASLRSQLRPRMAASALLNFTGFARNVEQAYRQMWTQWCRST